MNNYFIPLSLFTVIWCGCVQESERTTPEYRYISPVYGLLNLISTNDTLHFPLNDSTYNQIGSINIFMNRGKELISLFDQRSLSITFFDLNSKNQIKKISLKDLMKIRTAEDVSVYTRNIDSIFIADKKKLYLLDFKNGLKTTIPFITTSATAVKTDFEYGKPPVIFNSKIWTGVKSSGTIKSDKDARKWRPVYEFDLSLRTARLHYWLPEIYLSGYYGYQFLDNSYCYNANGRFVFSFAADTVIYETDFSGYHVAYIAKSGGHTSHLKPLTDLSQKDAGYKHYLINYAYGNIYFDSRTNRYLRVAQQNVATADYDSKNRIRRQSVIILDHNFKIIGESLVDNGIDINTLFFTTEGHIYARVKILDEDAVHFLRLAYARSTNKNYQFTVK